MKALWNDNWLFFTDSNCTKKAVFLPHDAMLSGRRDQFSPGKDAIGYHTGDVYHYEKLFYVAEEDNDKTYRVIFDGVYQNATIKLNGIELCFHPYGYTDFEVVLDSAILYGKENKLEVIADNSKLPNSRWYSGGGIYRDVYLKKAAKRCLSYQGIKITTLSIHPATIGIEVCLDGPKVDREYVDIRIFKDDVELLHTKGTKSVVEIPHAKLWSDESPELYECVVTVKVDDIVLDEETVTFGIRQLNWSKQGLFVNGKQTLLRGACVHHDNGLLGACSYYESEVRKVKLLKAHGYNALRMAHNPASLNLLRACDEYGMYVMDETFDMWYQTKNKYDYANYFREYYLEDTKAMVLHGYNHPSVIMYSIGNEIGEPAEPEGLVVAEQMVNLIHQLDPSRPVTAGINFMVLMLSSMGKGLFGENGMATKKFEESATEKEADKKSGSLMFNTMMTVMGKGINRIGNSKKADEATTPIMKYLDICGYNYANGRYEKEGKKHPERIIVGSETYPQDIYDNWKMVEKHPYIIGDFMWTGWDYLGEAAIGSWNYEGVSMTNIRYPWLLACAGTIDILGDPGASAAYASTVWNKTVKPYIGVRPLNHPGIRVTKAAWRGTNAVPSWAWNQCDGNKGIVEVYADGASVELWINGNQIGKKKLKKMKANFNVTYQKGEIVAKVYDAKGLPIGESKLDSAEGVTSVKILPEKKELSPNEVAYAFAEVQGKNGVREYNSDRRISVRVENGILLGFGSAKPNPTDSYLSNECETYYGQAQVIVKAKEAGDVWIKIFENDKLVAKECMKVKGEAYGK